MKYKIYAKNDCPYCKKAKELLYERGNDVEYLVIGEDISLESFKKEVMHIPVDQKTTVPQIFVGSGLRIGGYEDLTSYLENVSNGFGEQGF